MGKLGEAIDGVLAVEPSAPAVEFEGRWTSWGELARAKREIEAAVADLGPDLRIGVLIRNRPDTIPALLACAASDNCLVTLNPVYPDDKLAADIEECAPPVLIACAQDWRRPAVAATAEKIGALCLELTGDANAPVRQRAAMAKPFDAFARPRATGVGVEMLTSGTTGKPKRIPMRADAFALAVLAALTFEKGRKEGDPPQLRSGVQFLTGPMAHIGGLMAMFNAIIAGRKAFLMERFEVNAFLDAIKRHRPKVVGTPPAALRMVLDAKPPRDDLSSLSAYRTGTAPLDPALADAFYEAYGVPVLQNYGATEFGGVAGWTIADFKSHWKDKRGAVGRLNPGVEARVVDPQTQEELAPGVKGVLQLKGKQIGDGASWLATTDLAIVDDERFLFILGRADNAIVRGGFKVHPDDIVKAMQDHEAIREAAVTSLPDARLGHVPVAAYILKSDAQDPGGDALAAYLRQSLAPYQVPVRFLRVDEFPRTISMKVSQTDLRALFEAST